MECSDIYQQWNTLEYFSKRNANGYCVSKNDPQNPIVCDTLECTKKD